VSDTVRQNLMAAITMSSDEAKARVNAVLERRVPKVGRRKRAMMKMGVRPDAWDRPRWWRASRPPSGTGSHRRPPCFGMRVRVEQGKGGRHRYMMSCCSRAQEKNCPGAVATTASTNFQSQETKCRNRTFEGTNETLESYGCDNRRHHIGRV
jgi:hypothetical protein